jgi:hypothetical protein
MGPIDMLTFFTTAKPFRDHNRVIQRNALRSWKLLHPDLEVILFGDEEGTAEVSLELGLRHETHVERNEFGNKRLDYMFDRAQEISRHPVLCYVNCDILLLDDFLPAIRRVMAAKRKFLMVGCRWDVDITENLDFSNVGWGSEVARRARAANQQRDVWWIDYFAFSRGLYYKKIPPLVIGRIYWDNWLIWRAKKDGSMVVNASEAICAVHQNHDYGYHPQGKSGVWNDEVSRRNLELAGGFPCLRTIENANYRLTSTSLKWDWMGMFLATRPGRALWNFTVRDTLWLRSRLGLRKEGLRRLKDKFRRNAEIARR